MLDCRFIYIIVGGKGFIFVFLKCVLVFVGCLGFLRFRGGLLDAVLG